MPVVEGNVFAEFINNMEMAPRNIAVIEQLEGTHEPRTYHPLFQGNTRGFVEAWVTAFNSNIGGVRIERMEPVVLATRFQLQSLVYGQRYLAVREGLSTNHLGRIIMDVHYHGVTDQAILDY